MLNFEITIQCKHTLNTAISNCSNPRKHVHCRGSWLFELYLQILFQYELSHYLNYSFMRDLLTKYYSFHMQVGKRKYLIHKPMSCNS